MESRRGAGVERRREWGWWGENGEESVHPLGTEEGCLGGSEAYGAPLRVDEGGRRRRVGRRRRRKGEGLGRRGSGLVDRMEALVMVVLPHGFHATLVSLDGLAVGEADIGRRRRHRRKGVLAVVEGVRGRG